jgi:hypothetical protein
MGIIELVNAAIAAHVKECHQKKRAKKKQNKAKNSVKKA